MTFHTLRPGSTGRAVRELQAGLNARLLPAPQLRENGTYDAHTQQAVRDFQRQSWLAIDGIAGPCTQLAALGQETFSPILHNVRYLQQPTPTTCWAAAVAMMKSTTIDSVRLVTPTDMLLPDGSLRNEAEGPTPRTDLHRRFARIHGLHHHPAQCWLMSALLRKLSSGPLMIEALWNVNTFLAGGGSAGHYVVIIGARGNGEADGTTLRIYDPETPANGGGIYSNSYQSILRRVPLATYAIFTR